MAAANKPVWVQVAEAGFGDRLAELGWKQVSPAHWRLDGDGVIWRTLLGPARKDVLKDMLIEEARPNWPEEGALDRLMAGCFADETGFELVGLDDLIRTVFPDEKFRWMYPMIRRNVKVHGPYSIWLEFHYASFYEAAERREANWSWWDSFKEWTGLFSPTHYDELEDVEPAARSKNSYNGGWWNTTELGVEEVAARLTRRWEAWIRPKVESGMTAQDLLSLPMYTRDNPDKTYNEDLDIYAHYFVGDLDYCRRRLRAAVNQKVPTLEEELAWLEEVDFFDKPIARGRSDKEKKKQRNNLSKTPPDGSDKRGRWPGLSIWTWIESPGAAVRLQGGSGLRFRRSLSTASRSITARYRCARRGSDRVFGYRWFSTPENS